MQAVHTKDGVVTFYAWREGIPSCEKIRAYGGERQKDSNGTILASGEKHVQFAAGILHESDPIAIKELRKMIANGKDDMTEDREIFLKATLPIERQVKRNAELLAVKDKELNQSREEVSRLRAKLQEKAAAGDPRSKVKQSNEVPE